MGGGVSHVYLPPPPEAQRVVHRLAVMHVGSIVVPLQSIDAGGTNTRVMGESETPSAI